MKSGFYVSRGNKQLQKTANGTSHNTIKQKRITLTIQEEVDKLMTEHRHDLYLLLRKYVADSIKNDFHSKERFQKLDPNAIEERLVVQGYFDLSGIFNGT